MTDWLSEPLANGSKHSKVISNWYESPKAAGLFNTFTPNNETTDMFAAGSTLRAIKWKSYRGGWSVIQGKSGQIQWILIIWKIKVP